MLSSQEDKLVTCAWPGQANNRQEDFQAILIPACASSGLAFHMIYSAYKLNKQSDNIQP